MTEVTRSDKPLRMLSVSEIGVDTRDADSIGSSETDGTVEQTEDVVPQKVLDSSLYQAVVEAKEDGYAGAVFSGPPGTGKSWYAKLIATALAGSAQRVRIVQFHASYQYEDFIQGWVPDGSGGFVLKSKHFLELCSDAEADPDHLHVLVVDELSRADVGRVFGEALTYLETSKRGEPFFLASGKQVVVPPNLFVLATMNPWDISVGELDYALERRFAIIDVPPSNEELINILTANHAPPPVVAVAERFFSFLQGRANPLLHIGHAYFDRVSDKDSLRRLWSFQIRPHVARVCRLDLAEANAVDGAWKSIVLDGLAREQAEAAEPPAQQ